MTTTPVLDIFLPETHTSKLLAIGDVSFYPSGWTILTPTIEITPPGWEKIIIPFVANSVQVYGSDTLGITPPGCTTINLPDGMYTIKYSIAPAYKYFVEKTIFIVSSLYQQWEECWVKARIDCQGTSRTHIGILDGIECYIEAAIAAANQCHFKMANDLYTTAARMLQDYLNKC